MMYFINLTKDPGFKSHLNHKISKFPDGQQSVELFRDLGVEINSYDEVTIQSRLNSFLDLELIICTTKALRNMGYSNIHLFVPYFLGARSDRAFSDMGVNYLRDVICPIVNQQNYKSITSVDPHSDVLEACLFNFAKIPNYALVKFALQDYFGDSWYSAKPVDFSGVRVISPDAGALKKIHSVCEQIKYDQEIVVASKHRDIKTGKITETKVPITVHDADKDFFIIDDICDGGRTFIEIAKTIKRIQSLSSSVHPEDHGKIYLIVTHGIFSAGLKPLNEYFDGIYTTNSYSSMESPEFLKRNEGETHKLSQLNLI